MARYGIVADIHANLEALTVVLAALDARRVDRVVCLGDIVGYNANPNECAAIVAARGIASIAGNHDLISVNRLGLDRCSNKAAYALRRTRRAITSPTQRFLESLPPDCVHENRFAVVHGGVRDVQSYVRKPEHVSENVALLRAAHPGVGICFYGHTHEPSVFAAADDGTIEAIPVDTAARLDTDRVWFVNPGSVDASRKREHKFAEYAVFDTESLAIEFARLPYDDAATEEKSLRGGYRIGPLTDRVYTVRRRARAAVRKARRILGLSP